ncbi:hypothetical protein CL630_02440 [bacterium]|nr:hypothetical protein [bacterium]|tara:strand:+ start:579 stop:1121 length:543 start_codon:yes stop_codon:yes gene_type:complete
MVNILGLKITRHDTGAALISDKGVVAISEERLNRIKYSKNIFPELAISYCLKDSKIKPEEIDLIVIDQILLRSDFQAEKKFREWDKNNQFSKARIEVINHHDAHAASAFFCSPFDEAAVLIYDGYGEITMNQLGIPVAETETFYYGKENKLIEVQKTTHPVIQGARGRDMITRKHRYTIC